jgi:hypothetical protein
MPYSTYAKNRMLAFLASIGGWAALHSDDPGDTGVNELTVAPYARQPVVWAGATGGVIERSVDPVFSVAAGAVIRYASLWTERTGGSFLGSGPVALVTFTNAGLYTLTDIVADLLAA